MNIALDVFLIFFFQAVILIETTKTINIYKLKIIVSLTFGILYAIIGAEKTSEPIYDRLICSPLSDKLISTNRAFGLSGEAVNCRRICKAASGSLATIYR